MTASITVHVDDTALAASISAAIRASGELSPVFDAIGARLMFKVDERFQYQRGPTGGPWVQSLRARLEGGETLTDRSILRKSITRQVHRDHVLVGTNVLYARIHQFGGVIVPKVAKALKFRLANGAFVVTQKVTMPARPFLGLDAEDLEDIEAAFDRHFARALGVPT
jgi:phage virion morphogenesis protein